MSEIIVGENYKKAKAEADKVDESIIETLRQGVSFRVEAGAGSGKTYSLNNAIEWIQNNKKEEYARKKQTVICITYTNAAVDVITERLSDGSFIIPSTIHSFAWNAIKQYQSTLLTYIEEDETFQADEGDFSKVTEVKYTLGRRYVENGVQYIHHNDVLIFLEKLLNNAKFRRIFANKYPLILIDEYQDSYKPIIEKLIEFFISTGSGPQFGFFGDAWQTIYQSNNACGLIDHPNLKVIKKSSNFRSAPTIVNLLNTIRPELPQVSAIDGFKGETIAITCDDFAGARRTDRYFKGDLPIDELKKRIDELKDHIKSIVPEGESTKILMITHKVLAAQQGYERLLDIIADGLRDKEDPFLLFFMNTVEPIYNALESSNMQLLFDTLKIKRYPITQKNEKNKWMVLKQTLSVVRQKKSIDVLNAIAGSNLISIPPQVEGYYRQYSLSPDMIYSGSTSIKEFLELDYNQFLSAISFLYPDADYSTEHGVKGEEYDNVIFVISKGWNQYQFETYAPMITGLVAIPKGKEVSYERNRNLFYVCCSRAKKRLIFFVSLQSDPTFRTFLINLVGKNNVYTFSEYQKHN